MDPLSMGVGERITSTAGFWNTVLEPRQAASMAEKYAWLRREVLERPGSPRVEGLRAAARRWPGSLRECQQVSPARYRAREQVVRARIGAPLWSYGRFRSSGHVAVCLWSELHRLHEDVLAWRARAQADRRRDVMAFLRDLTDRDPRRRAAWPEAHALRAWIDLGVGARLAEWGLAIRAGWDRPTLQRRLLDEPG